MLASQEELCSMVSLGCLVGCLVSWLVGQLVGQSVSQTGIYNILQQRVKNSIIIVYFDFVIVSVKHS